MAFLRSHASTQVDLLIESKLQQSFATELHVFLACDKGRRCARSRADTAADQRSLAAGRKRADQRAAASAAADVAPVPLLVRTAVRYNFRSHHWNGAILDDHVVERESQRSRVMQSPRAVRA